MPTTVARTAAGNRPRRVDDLATDERVRVVVVRGAGRACCGGVDLTALPRDGE